MLNAKEKERIEFILNAHNQYKSIQIDIIQFLSLVCRGY